MRLSSSSISSIATAKLEAASVCAVAAGLSGTEQYWGISCEIMGRGGVKVVFVSYVTFAVVASMSTVASRMTSTLVTLAMAASVRGEVLELEEACGVLLQVETSFLSASASVGAIRTKLFEVTQYDQLITTE